MKRANSFAVLATTLIFSSVSSAQDDDPQVCANAAFDLTGETKYELLSAKPMVFGREWFELKLEAESGTEILCKIRRGRVTGLELELPEELEALATRG